jgi:hypothetical protein
MMEKPMLSSSRICLVARCLAATTALCLLTLSAGAEEDAISLAPNNPDIVAVIQVAETLDSPSFQRIASQFPDLIKLDEPLGKKTRLTPRDIESVVVTADTARQDFVVVFNLAREFGLDDVIDEEQRAKAEEIGDYTLYVLAEDNALCLVDEATIAMGPARSMRAILQRDDDAEISDELIAACNKIDEEQPIYVVATLGALAQRAADATAQAIPLTPETLGKLKIATITADTGENAIGIRANLSCTDPATAEQVKSLLDAVLHAARQADANTPAEIRQTLGTVETSIDHDNLTIRFDIGLDLIVGQIKSQLAAGANSAASP